MNNIDLKNCYENVFSRPKSLKENEWIYCPGCGHGIIHRLIAEVIDEMDIREKTIGVVPVGCAVFGYDYFNFDVSEAPHGRTPSVATGIKRVHPNHFVFTYQGDGDLAAIGTAEIIHTANRGENISVIFVNNGNYGMTGGQLAPTTLIGQTTTTSHKGRDPIHHGFPLKISEMLAITEGSRFIARSSVDSPKNAMTAKKYIRQAFEVQKHKLGFSLVEILSMCPVNWKLTPHQSAIRIRETVHAHYPLGVIKDNSGL